MLSHGHSFACASRHADPSLALDPRRDLRFGAWLRDVLPEQTTDAELLQLARSLTLGEPGPPVLDAAVRARHAPCRFRPSTGTCEARRTKLKEKETEGWSDECVLALQRSARNDGSFVKCARRRAAMPVRAVVLPHADQLPFALLQSSRTGGAIPLVSTTPK